MPPSRRPGQIKRTPRSRGHHHRHAGRPNSLRRRRRERKLSLPRSPRRHLELRRGNARLRPGQTGRHCRGQRRYSRLRPEDAVLRRNQSRRRAATAAAHFGDGESVNNHHRFDNPRRPGRCKSKKGAATAAASANSQALPARRRERESNAAPAQSNTAEPPPPVPSPAIVPATSASALPTACSSTAPRPTAPVALPQNAFGNNRRGPNSLYNGSLALVEDNSALDARSFSYTGQDTPKPEQNHLTIDFNFGGLIKIPRPVRKGPQLHPQLPASHQPQRHDERLRRPHRGAARR